MILGVLVFMIIFLLPILFVSSIASASQARLRTRRIGYGGKCPRCKSIRLQPSVTITKTNTTDGDKTTTIVSRETSSWVCLKCGNEFTPADIGKKHKGRKSKQASSEVAPQPTLAEKPQRVKRRSQPEYGTAKKLTFYLGLLGIDKFYMGHKWLGTLRLLLSASGYGLAISIPWWIVDIVLVSRHEADWSAWTHSNA